MLALCRAMQSFNAKKSLIVLFRMVTRMPDEALDIVELLLTVDIYNSEEKLDENDLPPRIRKHYWNAKEKAVKRPLGVRPEDIEKIYRHNRAIEVSKTLPFIEIEDIGSKLEFTVFELGIKWFTKQNQFERINKNPVLAFYYENLNNNLFKIEYKKVRKQNRPKEADKEWIQSLVQEVASQGEEAKDLLKLVQILAPEEVSQPLDQIILTKEQEEEVRKIVKAIEYREYLRNIGLREIGKLLFIGPPGTGKTSTARAMSECLGLPILEVRLSMLISQYLGETSKNIDKVFELARKLSPCIIFIDEFDFIGKTRTSDEHAALKRAVNTLLKAIDEISLINDGVLLIGATNHPQLLDHAAWRRFDEIVFFPLPDIEMRRRIMELILKQIKGSFDTVEIAEKTQGLSGSDLRLIVREAVLSALLEERTVLNQQDLLQAIKAFNERIAIKNVDIYPGGQKGMQ